MPLLSRRVLWIPLLASCCWLCLAWVLYHNASELALRHQQELEHMHLSTIARQLLSIRNWNADHGGIYVRESDIGRANPWLPEHMRHATTTDGRRLVLLNPAYMSRLLAERITSPGMSIAIVGKEPMRPGNKADAWESGALDQCSNGPIEFFTPPEDDATGKHMRLLAVLKAEQSCLKCHTTRKVGDVLGGISITQDASGYRELSDNQLHSLRMTYTFMGLTGLLVIGGLTGLLALRRWQAEETSRMQRTLMARLSHDMRTPLTGILGMTELLRNSETGQADRQQALHYLSRAGTSLLEMVRDITDHAQLEQEDITLCPAPFDLVATCEQCVALYQPVARAKGVGLDLVTGRSVPPYLMGDAFRIRQVLGNLVSNAVKFTTAGFVRVVVTGKQGDNGNCRLRLIVMDSGPGLPQGEEERIFDMFQRGSQGVQQPGTGLGLGIARGLARKMGGDVRAYNRARKGACFVLHLELPPAGRPEGNNGDQGGDQGGDQDTGVTEPETSLKGVRILVAEDNAPTRFFLQKTLHHAGASPVLVADGMQALAALAAATTPFDLVVLDARMPGVDGLELLARIRQGATAAPQGQRVIVYAAALDTAAREVCAKYSADAVLDKPLAAQALRAALSTVMRGGTVSTRPQQPEASPRPWDRGAALEGVDNDAAVFVRLCKVLHDDLREKIAQLDTMLARDDREGYRRLAHACKNSAGTLCLHRLQAAARVAEAAGSDMTHTAAALGEAMREAVALLEKEIA